MLKVVWETTATAGPAPYAIDTIEPISAEFLLEDTASLSDDVLPAVDETTGAETDGEQFVRWAEYVDDNGTLVQSENPRCGSNQVIYCEEAGSYLMQFERVSS